MENKRIIIATVLCFVILLGWQSLAEYMGWVQPVPTATVSTQTEQDIVVDNTIGEPMGNPEIRTPVFAPSEGKNITVKTPLYTAVFHSAGAVLQSFEINGHKEFSSPDSPPLNLVSDEAKIVSPMGLLIDGQPSWSKGSWAVSATDLTLASGEKDTLVFEGSMVFKDSTDLISIRRELTFDATTYLIDEKVTLSAPKGNAYIVQVGYTLAASAFSPESSYDMMKVAWDMEGSFDENADVDLLVEEGLIENGALYWGGIMNNYFLSAVVPASKNGVIKARIQNNVWRVGVETTPATINSGESVTQSVSWWHGPKDGKLLAKAPNELEKALNFGFFGILAKPLLWLLEFFYGFVHNWGVAIILLTVFIKMLFWPLTKKSYKSMEQMKRIAPLMEEVKKKNAGNKEAMSREMMQLYKTYNVNPMSGCLPILVQLPVFISLYQALLHSNNLRHAEFITYLPFTDILWLSDLSVQDPFYITPLLMGITMFIQQWLSPAVGDPMQRKIMLLMPVIFTFMFLSFPAGLVIYWLVNNILSIAQQWWTLRKV